MATQPASTRPAAAAHATVGDCTATSPTRALGAHTTRPHRDNGIEQLARTDGCSRPRSGSDAGSRSSDRAVQHRAARTDAAQEPVAQVAPTRFPAPSAASTTPKASVTPIVMRCPLAVIHVCSCARRGRTASPFERHHQRRHQRRGRRSEEQEGERHSTDRPVDLGARHQVHRRDVQRERRGVDEHPRRPEQEQRGGGRVEEPVEATGRRGAWATPVLAPGQRHQHEPAISRITPSGTRRPPAAPEVRQLSEQRRAPDGDHRQREHATRRERPGPAERMTWSGEQCELQHQQARAECRAEREREQLDEQSDRRHALRPCRSDHAAQTMPLRPSRGAASCAAGVRS